jgi:hypothetical protein
MTELRRLVEGLRRELGSPRSQAWFRQAREARDAFQPVEDVAGLLRILADGRDSTYPEREAITRALLSEHAESGAGLWSSVLIVAYYPMLSRLRRRIVGDIVSPEDLDQVVLTAFMTSVRELALGPPRDRVAMRLRQRTERQVFAVLRKERMEQHLPLDPDDVSPSPDAARLGVRDESQAERQRVAFAAAELMGRAGLTPGGLSILIATLLKKEPLRHYVSRVVPEGGEARERAYQRLKRQRTRALQRLRLAARESPVASDGAL